MDDFLNADPIRHKLIWLKSVVFDVDRDGWGDFGSAVHVACIEETSGIGVWYLRTIRHEGLDAIAKAPDGHYLLRLYSHAQRHAAIEAAVLIANRSDRPEELLPYLDELALRAVARID